MLDLRIIGGEVIDGSGAPRRRADIGIEKGRIETIAAPDSLPAAAKTIDAQGKLVAPGFIDIHTHYDAQVFWDATLSPSPFHGVTTVVGGNCGFSIAPLVPDAGDYLMRMLARVEGMPLESLQAGVPWNWESFAEYLEAVKGRLAVNAGFLVGHCALRRVVMGERAVGNEASADELAAMKKLLAASLESGGMGFSSSISVTHNDGDGRPVPSRFASRDELVGLAEVVSDYPGTTVEFLPGVGVFSDEQKQLMTDISVAANRPVNWNVLAPTAGSREVVDANLAASDFAKERGGRVVALTVPQPMTVRLNFTSGFVLDALPGWAEILGLPIPQRMQALADPAIRKQMDQRANSEEAGLLRGLANWSHMIVNETFDPANGDLVGKTIGEIASGLGKTPFDAMLDLVLSEDLKTSLRPMTMGEDDESWKLRAEVWQDERAVIGASDAGAHLDMIDTFAFSTQVLGNGVRRRGLLSFEEAVRQLTDVPARLYGLRERGRLEEGWHADVVVFDPACVDSGPTYTRFDLPADAGRLYADAEGIDHVVVAGEEIIRGSDYTGAKPGAVLHSGRDTETVEAGA